MGWDQGSHPPIEGIIEGRASQRYLSTSGSRRAPRRTSGVSGFHVPRRHRRLRVAGRFHSPDERGGRPGGI